LDEDGDPILSDAPEMVAKRTKTARLKAMKAADPKGYGLPTDPKSVRERKETIERMERAERKRIARRVIPEGSRLIGVPTIKMTATPDSVEPSLHDPRAKADEPVEITHSPDIPEVDSLVRDNKTGEQILSVVSRQIDIFAGQIEIMKTLIPK